MLGMPGGKLLVAFVVGAVLHGAHANQDIGIIGLDNTNFDKIIGGPRPVLVRFDQEYSYGDPADAYRDAAWQLGSSEALVATVGLSEYSENDNYQLAERFGAMSEEEFPVYMFFPAHSKEAVQYSGAKDDASAILQFMRKQGVYVGLPGTMKEFEPLAKEFMADKDSRMTTLQSSEKVMAELEEKGNAVHYVTTMKKIMNKGDSYVQNEIDRLTKLKDQESVKPEKQEEFATRINILYSFMPEAK